MPSIMRTMLLLATSAPRVAAGSPPRPSSSSPTATRMEVQSYEIKEGVVLLKTKEGKLMSVPRTYVNLPATEQANKAKGESPPPPRDPRRRRLRGRRKET